MALPTISERKKKIAAFAGIYIASIILLLFIFSAFGWQMVSGKTEEEKYASNNAFLLDKDLLRADSLLHTEMWDLELADKYYSLLADSTNVTERGSALVNTFNAVNTLQKTIDSIEQLTSYYKGDLGSRYKMMLSTFKSELNSRLLLKNTKTTLVTNTKTSSTAGSGDIFYFKNELLLKDQEIATLKATIKDLHTANQFPSAQAGKTEAQKGEIDLLKTAFSDLQKDYELIKDRYNRLKIENSNTLLELSEARKAPLPVVEKTNNIADTRVTKLEKQVDDLNAALYFAKIDCNLSRTDARQMISNAKQRKQLLSESLTMLNSLAKSGDAGIQKKAIDKIALLNQIAVTLHD
ncbi:MAG: hypothetical protein QM726_23265 [Chitinophagaceae bacterium]